MKFSSELTQSLNLLLRVETNLDIPGVSSDVGLSSIISIKSLGARSESSEKCFSKVVLRRFQVCSSSFNLEKARMANATSILSISHRTFVK